MRNLKQDWLPLNHEIFSKIEELALGGIIMIITYFGRRALTQYDKRLSDMKKEQNEIMKTLNRIDKEVVKISTKLDML